MRQLSIRLHAIAIFRAGVAPLQRPEAGRRRALPERETVSFAVDT
jgi:hypothetical protein